MTTTALAILLGAVLFVVLGLLPYRGCDGHCPGCGQSCERYDTEGEHHAR
jgi:hypothetical protein